MSQALQDLGGAPASAPLLTLSQSRALADLLDQARKISRITSDPVERLLLDRPRAVHLVTMQALVQAGMLSEQRLHKPTRSRVPGMRWRLTAAGLRVATSPCPAAEAATGGRA
jgi:hypothetical protein